MSCYPELVSTIGSIALSLMFITSSAHAQRPEPKKTELRGDTMYTVSYTHLTLPTTPYV